MRLKKSALQSLFVAFAAVAMIGASTMVLPANARSMHLRLDRAEPAIDTTITKAPTEIRLHFSEAVKAPLTAIKIMGPDSVLVQIEPLTLGVGKIPPVVARIKGVMKPGLQKVDWRTQGSDGHALTGSFSFNLKTP
jgi:methionine-rich copper-binding protein CopC